MKINFYATLLAFSLSLSACELDTFNEQDAIAAQKELMNTRYQNETELEKLRNAAATALEQLRYTNALAELQLNDELSRGAVAAMEAARQANALALESARLANALALQDNANAAAVAAAKAKAEVDAAAAAKAAEVAENARLVQARKDYTVAVTDINTRMPLADADVTVASEGKIITAKTNAVGVASFNGLLLFPISRFNITKTGFTSASVTVLALGATPVGLLNVENARNEVKGKLYIETDLTNTAAEVVPANTLVTASTNPNNGYGTYTLQIAARTDAAGNYSMKLPDAPAGYTLDFGQVEADQKIYINGIENYGIPASAGFPNHLPQLATLKTYFDVKNAFGLTLPDQNRLYSQRFYFKLPADLDGDVAYFNASGVNTAATGTGNEFIITGLNAYSSPVAPGGAILRYAPNVTLDVQLVDWTGKYVKNAPHIVAYTNSSGNLSYENQYNAANTTTGNTATNSYGFLHFKRENVTVANPAGNTVAGAQGIFAISDDLSPNIISSGYNTFNATYNNYNNGYYYYYPYNYPGAFSTNYMVNPQGGQMIVRNFYYGHGANREQAAF